jgi:hypothetical protein
MGSRGKPTAEEQALARWRREVRRAIPRADGDLVEEVAQHVSERWLSAKTEGLSDGAADARVHRDLEEWRTTAVPCGTATRSSGIGWGADVRAGCDRCGRACS